MHSTIQFIDPDGRYPYDNNHRTNRTDEDWQIMHADFLASRESSDYRLQEELECVFENLKSLGTEIIYEEALAMVDQGDPGDPPTKKGSVGQPGIAEGMIPVWGSSRAAIDHFQQGNYGWGAFHTAMAVSDVFLVKSIATGLGKGAWKAGSHSWSATRKWLGKNGYAEAGQPVHHWLVPQAAAKKYRVEGLTNQPWNLMTFPNQSLHMRAGHGINYLGQPGYGALGQFWYGTTTWFKAGMFSGGGRIID